MAMDRDQRALERRVESDPGEIGGRQALTNAMLRSRSGVAAWWPGTIKPHPAAVKTAIGFDVVRPNGTVRRETVGWLLGLTTASDVLDIAALRGGCRLIDLATLRTVGMFGQAGAVTPAVPKLMAATVDALGRPRVSASDAELSDEIYDRLIPPDADPDFSTGQRRLVSESLWDSEVFVAGGSVTTLPFFQNTVSFSDIAAGSKSFGFDTNLIGNGGCLPARNLMVVNGISILLSAGAQKVTQDVDQAVRSSSHTRLILGAATMHDFKTSDLIPIEPGVTLGDASAGDAVSITGSAPATYPLAVPLVLHPFAVFGVEVRLPERRILERVLVRDGLDALKMTCVLHGHRFGPVLA